MTQSLKNLIVLKRYVAKVLLSDRKLYYKQFATAYIPGQGHNIQQHSVVLLRWRACKRFTGCALQDFTVANLIFLQQKNFNANKGRSKYAIKK